MLVEHTPDIYYRFCSLPLADEIDEIQTIVAEHDIDVIVVDSMGAASGSGSEESAWHAVALRYFRALRSLRKTSLSIHHINKEGTLFGSVYNFNYARNLWEAKKAQAEGENTMAIGLFHRKANSSALMKPLGIAANFTRSMISFQPVKPI